MACGNTYGKTCGDIIILIGNYKMVNLHILTMNSLSYSGFFDVLYIVMYALSLDLISAASIQHLQLFGGG